MAFSVRLNFLARNRRHNIPNSVDHIFFSGCLLTYTIFKGYPQILQVKSLTIHAGQIWRTMWEMYSEISSNPLFRILRWFKVLRTTKEWLIINSSCCNHILCLISNGRIKIRFSRTLKRNFVYIFPLRELKKIRFPIIPHQLITVQYLWLSTSRIQCGFSNDQYRMLWRLTSPL